MAAKAEVASVVREITGMGLQVANGGTKNEDVFLQSRLRKAATDPYPGKWDLSPVGGPTQVSRSSTG